jgi:hypothetical protein
MRRKWLLIESLDLARSGLSPRVELEDVDVVDGEDGCSPLGHPGDLVVLKVPVVCAHADAGVRAQ